jgi:hypothetical protein
MAAFIANFAKGESRLRCIAGKDSNAVQSCCTTQSKRRKMKSDHAECRAHKGVRNWQNYSTSLQINKKITF